MSDTKKLLLSVVGLVLIIGAVVVLEGNGGVGQNQSATSTPATSTAAGENTQNASQSVPDSWQMYQEGGLSFAYPQDAELTTEAGKIKIQILGPSNEPNTEVTDGLTGYLYSVEKEAGGLADTAERVLVDRSSTAQQVIASTSPATFAEKTGYSFRLQNQLGSETVYYVLPSEQSGLSLIANFTASGPNTAEFIDQFETITKTAQVKNNAGTNSEDESNGL
jgi:hypothetical protein